MDNKDCVLLGELAREIGVQPYRIAYAHRHGRLPEPPRIGDKRVYDAAAADMVRAYFAGKHDGRRKADKIDHEEAT